MLHVILTTKNKSIYVKTLHSMLTLESACSQLGIQMDVTFVNDDMQTKMDILKKKIKVVDRIMWIEYGVCIDKDTIKNMIIKYNNNHALVFPTLKEGVDWDMFRQKCKDGSSEPAHQLGMNFDVDISNKIIDKENNFYEVLSCTPHCWTIDCKPIMKKLKDKNKKDFVFPSTIDDFFKKCISKGVRVGASVDSRTYNHFTHECIGNIMNIPNIVVS